MPSQLPPKQLAHISQAMISSLGLQIEQAVIHERNDLVQIARTAAILAGAVICGYPPVALAHDVAEALLNWQGDDAERDARLVDQVITCGDCDGTGSAHESDGGGTCELCKGKGSFTIDPATITVREPIIAQRRAKSRYNLDERIAAARIELKHATDIMETFAQRSQDDTGKVSTPSFGQWIAADCRYTTARSALAGLLWKHRSLRRTP